MASSLSLSLKSMSRKYLLQYQAFRFMVGPGHGPLLLECGPSLFKAVGPVDPSFLIVKKSLIEIFILQRVCNKLLKTESTWRLSIQ